MLKISRTSAVVKNITAGIVGQIFNQLLGFVSRTIFIQLLGVVYLGINGLFSNIFSVLSLVELGIGSAIVFSLYKPLAEKDEYKIEALMTLYARAYKVIGFVIFFLGALFIPFLDCIIKDKPDIPDFKFIYVLFLINAVITYFFSYSRSIFYADQKNYINVLNINIFSFLTKFLQIGVLILTNSFIHYLMIQILATLLSNLDITRRAKKAYPYLKNRTGAKLSIEDLKLIKKNMSALFLLRIGSIVVNATDNLLISSFFGVVWVGVYSNYLMLISFVQGFIAQFFTPITASVGNLVNSEGKEKEIDVFLKLFFVNFIIYGFCCICLFVLMNPFITLWIGEQFLLPDAVVFVIVLNVYLMGIRNVLWVYTNALGLFYHFRFIPFFEVVINLAFSLFLLKEFGIIGVFLGATISTVTTYLVAEPYVLFKGYFKLPLKMFFERYVLYFSSTLIVGGIAWFLSALVNDALWTGFFIKLLMTVITVCTMFLVFFYKTNEFQYFTQLLNTLYAKIRFG